MAKKNHDKDNAVFERFVTSPQSVIAMIAYCLYRLEKIDYFKKNPNMKQQEKDAACATLIAGNHFDRFVQDASKAISAATDQAVADATKGIKRKGFWAGVGEGVVAGLITLILAPIVWVAISHLLAMIDVWNPFVALVNTLDKNNN